jgi:hypothetical protein
MIFTEVKEEMLKKKLGIISTVLAFFLLLAPAASQALPAFSPQADVTASFLDRLAHWLDLLAGGPGKRTPAPGVTPRTAQNGCGIDPQGQPTCTPGTPGAPTPGTTPPGDGIVGVH